MTTQLEIYRSALEHIRNGSDVVCTRCGWMGCREDCAVEVIYKRCPECGGLIYHGHRHMAAYVLAQGEEGEA